MTGKEKKTELCSETAQHIVAETSIEPDLLTTATPGGRSIAGKIKL